MLMLMLMTTIDYYHSLCLLFLSGGFLKCDTPKSPWVSILKLSIVTKWKLFHVIWNIFQIWETAALFQKYSIPDLCPEIPEITKKSLIWKVGNIPEILHFDDNWGYPDKTQTSPSRKSLRRTSWDDGRENAKIFLFREISIPRCSMVLEYLPTLWLWLT